MVAGVMGCLARELFFALTRGLVPPQQGVLPAGELPESSDSATGVVARRLVDELVGPVEDAPHHGVVRYAFDSGWGAVYGVVAGTIPAVATLRGGVTFGIVVGLISDDLLLPWLGLRAWPAQHPMRTHLYAIAAHAAYGASLSVGFAGARRASTPAAVALGSVWLTRNVPSLLRPSARSLARRGLRVALPVRRVVAAMS
jgi:hypothetical protein